MQRIVVCLILLAPWAGAQTRLSLSEAVRRALEQSPEVALAKLDERRAEQAVRLARDPFSTRLVVGSGLAYTSGFPLSIEGSAPSVVQARAIQALWDRPQKLRVEQARQETETAARSREEKQREVARRTAELWLEAEYLARASAMAGSRIERLEAVRKVMEALVEEGRELPVEGRRAALRVAESRHRALVFEGEALEAQTALAAVLGYGAGERVEAGERDRALGIVAAGGEAAVEAALAASVELRRLESAAAAKQIEARSHLASRLPKVDLVAQYALLGRFNNYADFFNRFERHNFQLGASFQLPVLAGSGTEAAAERARMEAAQLRLEAERARTRIAQETLRRYREWQTAESARQVASLDLEVAQAEAAVVEARAGEGRAGVRELEEHRYRAAEKQALLEEAALAIDRARLGLLDVTGTLLSTLE